MSRQRRKHHPIMARVGGYHPPNHVMTMADGAPYMFRSVVRECGYCNEEYERDELTKLPNGLFICDDHPDGEERDRLQHI